MLMNHAEHELYHLLLHGTAMERALRSACISAGSGFTNLEKNLGAAFAVRDDIQTWTEVRGVGFGNVPSYCRGLAILYDSIRHNVAIHATEAIRRYSVMQDEHRWTLMNHEHHEFKIIVHRSFKHLQRLNMEGYKRLGTIAEVLNELGAFSLKAVSSKDTALDAVFEAVRYMEDEQKQFGLFLAVQNEQKEQKEHGTQSWYPEQADQEMLFPLENSSSSAFDAKGWIQHDCITSLTRFGIVLDGDARKLHHLDTDVRWRMEHFPQLQQDHALHFMRAVEAHHLTVADDIQIFEVMGRSVIALYESQHLDVVCERAMLIQPQTQAFEAKHEQFGNLVYKPCTRLLLVHIADFVDAMVISYEHLNSQCRMLLGNGSYLEKHLTAVNHCQQQFVTAREYRRSVHSYCVHLTVTHAYLKDQITGVQLRTCDQLLNIGMRHNLGVRCTAWVEAQHIGQLAELMVQTQVKPPVLIIADAGAGKTWASIRLTFEIAQWAAHEGTHGPLVPLLVPVQRLISVLLKLQRTESGNEAHRLTEDQLLQKAFTGTPAVKVLLQYLAELLPRQQPECNEWQMMLQHALELRTGIVVIDGVDKAAGHKFLVAKFLQELVQGGIHVVVTSRPEGVNLKDYVNTFVVVDLKPLTEAQQHAALETQMEYLPREVREFKGHLLSFSSIRMKHDQIWNQVFDSPQTRNKVEKLHAPDMFQLQDGKGYDPDMRQKWIDGTRFVQRRQGGPFSMYLLDIDRELSSPLSDLGPEMYSDLDAAKLERFRSYLRQRRPEYNTVADRLCFLYRKKQQKGDKALTPGLGLTNVVC